MDIKSLLESAIVSLSENCSIESIMLKAQTIAHVLKDDNFKKWINSEQNGYADDEQLPVYRILGCQVYVDISQPFGRMINNYSFPPGLMGKLDNRLFKMPFHNPLIEIEKLSVAKGQIRTEVIAAIYPEMNKYINGNILNARQCLSPESLSSIPAVFKSKLLDFFLQLNEKFDINIDLTKMDSKKTIETIMQQTIYAGVVNTGSGDVNINDSNIINGNNNITIDNELKKELDNLLKEISCLEINDVNDKEDIDKSITDIKKEINSSKSDAGIIRRSLRILKSIPTIIINQGIAFCVDQLLEKLSTLV